MKYWRKRTFDPDNNIKLIDPQGGGDRIVILSHIPGGFVVICEGCDEFHGVTLTKRQAVAALQEAINWVKNLP